MRDPDFTLAAGPVMASPRVLAALGSPLVYHYDPAFLEAFRRTERKLAQIFLTGNDVLLMQGEAVLGLEAAARGLVQPGSRVLNLVQGVFGKGMGYWLKDFGAELHELEVPYNDAVDPADVERYLDEHPGIDLVTVVHSETPSGTLCDVSAIGPIALDEDSEPEPDVAVVPGAPDDYAHAHPSRPVLTVEVAESSLALDRQRKGSLYARAGLSDYWVLNLIDRVLAGSAGQEAQQSIFRVTNPENEALGLRFDLTVPLARVVARRNFATGSKLVSPSWLGSCFVPASALISA